MTHHVKLILVIFLHCIVQCLDADKGTLASSSLNHDEEGTTEADLWLQEHNLPQYKTLFKENGLSSLVSCAQLPRLPGISSLDWEKLERASNLLRSRLILKKWLSLHNIESLYSSLLEFGVASLDDVCSLEPLPPELASTPLNEARQQTLSLQEGLETLKASIWDDVVTEVNQQGQMWNSAWTLLISVLVAGAFGFAFMAQPYYMVKAKPSLLKFVTGRYLHVSTCKVFFEWNEPKRVGDTCVFTVKFYQRNGQPYPICNADSLTVEVFVQDQAIATVCQLGGSDPSQANVARIKFTPKRAGEYKIAVAVGGCHLRGSPFIKNFLSGPPDPTKTQLLKHSSIVVSTVGVRYDLAIEPRDEFNNLCSFYREEDATCGYSVNVSKSGTNEPASDVLLTYDGRSRRVFLSLNFDSEGCYSASVTLNDEPICCGTFDVIILNNADAELVRKNVADKNHDVCYEARLLKVHSETYQKPKKVFCYISPKQVTIREFILKFIPIRLYTFRLCPSTKISFHESNNSCSWPRFAIDDGCQPRVELASGDRNIIAATFTHFLLKNIGGSETFKNKQEFFYHEVRKFHQKHPHDRLMIKINRDKLVESSMRGTRSFSISDWCKNFEIKFVGEQGLDWGGVSREWFNVVCSALFDSKNELFTSFSDNQQALVHPNPKRPAQFNLKTYEFAGKIVGKCLYESALGGKFRQLVKAKFTRSFLAQIIGLRIHYKYFEQDDPDLYLSKIKYIEENDVSEMDLYFVEEEYCESGQLNKTVDLIPNGSKTRVSNETKLHYLNCLAQYRLVSSVKAEVDHFLKGLNELIPDSLLSIFDENELELLLCGAAEYDVADFKAHHMVVGGSHEFRRSLDWFWAAVTNFTVEEMARLLQFTTGCSQLPPGGFKELTPKFTIMAAPTYGKLPTAHTCFNQLCLPGYDSYEQFESALLLAIKEGSEGFGFV